MKKVAIPILLLILTTSLFAQPSFDLGLKAGINRSKMSLDADDYSSESITKGHFGVFARVGLGRVFVQPEAYFSAKGGDLSSNVIQTATSFDYTSFDVPLLLGIQVVKDRAVGMHVVAGPVFSFLTSNKIDGNDFFSEEFYGDSYIGFQYGVGLDILFLTLDARMEHGSNNLYEQPNFDGKNSTFMLSVGFKIL